MVTGTVAAPLVGFRPPAFPEYQLPRLPVSLSLRS